MIKFMGTRNGRKFLGIVIVDGNLQRLKKNEPIHFNAEEMGLPEIKVKEIAIFYAPTEQAFYKMAEEHGLISKETIIHKEGISKQ